MKISRLVYLIVIVSLVLVACSKDYKLKTEETKEFSDHLTTAYDSVKETYFTYNMSQIECHISLNIKKDQVARDQLEAMVQEAKNFLVDEQVFRDLLGVYRNKFDKEGDNTVDGLKEKFPDLAIIIQFADGDLTFESEYYRYVEETDQTVIDQYQTWREFDQ